MKKALVISYHFPPLNAVASYRARAYAQYFHKSGVFPTIVTHRWEIFRIINNKREWVWHTGKDDVLYENNEAFKVIRVPRVHFWINKIIKCFSKFSFTNKALVFISWLSGYFDASVDDLDSYISFKRFLFNHLKKEKYDIIIGIFSPHHHLKLCYEIYQKFGIPYVLDFRDLWDNEVANVNYKPNTTRKLRDYLVRYYWKRWLSKANFFSITNDVWLEIIKSFTQKDGTVVMNGYEEDSIQIEGDKEESIFSIHFAGTLYPAQDVDLFLDGFNLFVKRYKPTDVRLRFMGLHEKYRPGIKGYIRKKVEGSYLEFIDKKPKEEAIKFINSACILFYPAFKDIRGWCSAKVFDYIASRKNILIAPGDNGLVDQLISETKSGVVINNSKGIVDYLEAQYLFFKDSKKVITSHDLVEIQKYSRESQVLKLADQICERV